MTAVIAMIADLDEVGSGVFHKNVNNVKKSMVVLIGAELYPSSGRNPPQQPDHRLTTSLISIVELIEFR